MKADASSDRVDVGDFLTARFTKALDQLRAHEDGVRAGSDIEAVHQARVATRRLRSELQTFAPLVDDEVVRRLRVDLAWLGSLLGEIRDPQVLIVRLVDGAGAVDADPALLGGLIGKLDDRAKFHHSQLRNAMTGDRYRGVLAALAAASDDPPARRPKLARRPAGPRVEQLAGRQWTTARKFARALGETPTDTELHDLRKRLKRSRYAAHAARSAGVGTKQFTRQLTALQDRLGEHHDLVVLHDFLLEASSTLPPPSAFLAGRLVQDADLRRREFGLDWPGMAQEIRRLRFG